MIDQNDHRGPFPSFEAFQTTFRARSIRHGRFVERDMRRTRACSEIVVRRNRAETYLAERAIPMSHVAAMLGYAEQSSFNRACLRWFGTMPGERRRGLQRRPGKTRRRAAH